MKNTLLILGAGASKAVHSGFPTGLELAQLLDVHLITSKYPKQKWSTHGPYISPMINCLRGAFPQLNTLNHTDSVIDELKLPLWGYVQDWYYTSFHSAPPPISIDQLIPSIQSERKALLVEIAKFCIAYFIKGAEHGLVRSYQEGYKTHNANWIANYICSLRKHHSITTIKDRLTVLTFNYDRVFEFVCLQNFDSIPCKDVIHVYNPIASLEEFPFTFNNDEKEELRSTFRNIQLIGERSKIDPLLRVENFDEVLFIGFGYNEENMSCVLKIDKGSNPNCKGMALKEKNARELEVERLYGFEIIPSEDISSFLASRD